MIPLKIQKFILAHLSVSAYGHLQDQFPQFISEIKKMKQIKSNLHKTYINHLTEDVTSLIMKSVLSEEFDDAHHHDKKDDIIVQKCQIIKKHFKLWLNLQDEFTLGNIK